MKRTLSLGELYTGRDAARLNPQISSWTNRCVALLFSDKDEYLLFEPTGSSQQPAFELFYVSGDVRHTGDCSSVFSAALHDIDYVIGNSKRGHTKLTKMLAALAEAIHVYLKQPAEPVLLKGVLRNYPKFAGSIYRSNMKILRSMKNQSASN